MDDFTDNTMDLLTKLEPYVTPARQERIETILSTRLQSISLALEAPADINNAFAAIRSSEAFGITTIHIINPERSAQFGRQISKGAIYWVEIIYHESFTDFLTWRDKNNFLLAGGSPIATQALQQIPIDKPICLIMGNEQRGLSDEALAACDLHYYIPMFGMTESLNLSVSAAISLYDTTTRKRCLLNTSGDLSPEKYLQLKTQYYLQSVDGRLAASLKK